MNWHHLNYRILGLSETEATILGTLSEPKTVQGIAQASQLSRTGINHSLKKLARNGLVHFNKKGKRRFYACLTPLELRNKLEQITNGLEESIQKGGVSLRLKKSEFKIHVGTKEIIPAYQRIAFENKNERIRAIQHHRSWNELVDKITPKQLVNFNDAIKKNDLIIDGMLNENAYKAYQEEIASNPKKNKEVVESLEGRMADYSVFPDNIFDYDAEIWLFKNTTLLISWKEEVAIEISNANMTGFMKDMFEYVKSGNRKLDHSQALKDSLK